MPVNYKDLVLCNTDPAVTLEDVFRKFGAYGGLLNTKFDSRIDVDTFVAGDWEVGSGTWTFDTTISGTGNTNTFDICWWKEDLPNTYVVDVELHDASTHQCIAFRGDGAGYYYVLEVNSTSVSFWKVQNHVATKLSDLDATWSTSLVGPGTLRLAVREAMFSDKDYDRWLFMSAWLDGHWLLTAQDHIQNQVLPWRFGLGVRNGETVEFDAVRVPDLTNVVPVATLDPDEAPMSGISRAIQDRVVKFFVRRDGTLRAWRPKPTAVSMGFSTTHLRNLEFAVDTREVVSHLRFYYALTWVDIYNDALCEAYGHTFAQVDNQTVETETEALEEADAMQRRMLEGTRTISFSTLACGPLLEPEDRIAILDDADFLVNSVSMDVEGQKLRVDIKGRLYAFSE